MDDREGGGEVTEEDGGVQTGGGDTDELSTPERHADDIRDGIRLRHVRFRYMKLD